MPVTPAAVLCVITGRSRDDVDETLNSDAAKAFALNAPAEWWASHGAQHPLGDDFAGLQDLIPQTLDEQTVLAYTKRVPVSLLKEALLTGTPEDVIEQAAEMARSRTALPGGSEHQHLAAQPAQGLGSGSAVLQGSARPQETVKTSSCQRIRTFRPGSPRLGCLGSPNTVNPE
jgi:alkanesulfonate monooxygenase SsuD/methylene tetrahydromethanopterin reductase-like flavin-dependent oxidoreductase (luciferase family)